MFNSKNKETHRYIDHEMMMEKSEWDGGDNGKGDAMWRTAIAYIAYGEPRLKTAIIKCFRKFTMINKKGYFYQASRAWNRYREDDVSRDQVFLALTSLKFNGEAAALKEITDHLPKRLSRRFKMSFVGKLWIKSMVTESPWYNFWFHFFELVEFVPSVLINKLLRPLAGRSKIQDPEWHHSVDTSFNFWYQSWDSGSPVWVYNTDPDKYTEVTNGERAANNYRYRLSKNSLLRFLNTIMYPGYALHLVSWMTYVSGDSILKQLLQKFILWEADDHNLLIKMLMGRSVHPAAILGYTPAKNYRWSGRMDRSYHFEKLTDDDALYNTLDKDLILKLSKLI